MMPSRYCGSITHFRRRDQRRGFATILALIMIVLVGVAVTGLTRSFAHQALRTRNGAIDAQLRQLLAAGAAFTADQSRSWGQAPQAKTLSFGLPPDLSGRGGALSIKMGSPMGGAVEVAIDAVLTTRRARQTLHYTRAAGAWRLADAVLNNP